MYVSVGAESAGVVQQDGQLQLQDMAGQRGCFDGTGAIAADVTNTDAVHVVSDGTFSIVPLSGPFGPGFTHEATGRSEIEFDVTFTTAGQSLIVDGTADTDHMILGVDGLNVNGDDDADVTAFGDPLWHVDGMDGNDTISALGAWGTGGAMVNGAVLDGGAGNDHLIGGRGGDMLIGGTGSDLLEGRSGNDELFGLSVDPLATDDPTASDHLDGGRGDDQLFGGPGSDSLFGADGNDVILAADGVSDRVSGGRGIDAATVDAGLDHVVGVETIS